MPLLYARRIKALTLLFVTCMQSACEQSLSAHSVCFADTLAYNGRFCCRSLQRTPASLQRQLKVRLTLWMTTLQIPGNRQSTTVSQHVPTAHVVSILRHACYILLATHKAFSALTHTSWSVCPVCSLLTSLQSFCSMYKHSAACISILYHCTACFFTASAWHL